jgi:hypothetical protein
MPLLSARVAPGATPSWTKLSRADGTARFPCGRVGRRRIFPLTTRLRSSEGRDERLWRAPRQLPAAEPPHALEAQPGAARLCAGEWRPALRRCRCGPRSRRRAPPRRCARAGAGRCSGRCRHPRAHRLRPCAADGGALLLTCRSLNLPSSDCPEGVRSTVARGSIAVSPYTTIVFSSEDSGSPRRRQVRRAPSVSVAEIELGRPPHGVRCPRSSSQRSPNDGISELLRRPGVAQDQPKEDHSRRRFRLGVLGG